MKNLKIYSTLASIISLILMIGGIGIATYYVDNLTIRGLFVFILILLNILVANTRKLISKL